MEGTCEGTSTQILYVLWDGSEAQSNNMLSKKTKQSKTKKNCLVRKGTEGEAVLSATFLDFKNFASSETHE